jgi:hypothetical protein
MERKARWRGSILAACVLTGVTTVWAADPGASTGRLVMVARDRSRGIELAYRTAGDGVARTEGGPPTHLEILSGAAPVPVALAVADGAGHGAGARRTLVADGLTAVPVDVGSTGPTTGTISAVACPRGATKDACRCTIFHACAQRAVGRGRGTKLTCRGGAPEYPCAPRSGPCFGKGGCVLDARGHEDGGPIVCAGDSNTVPKGWCRQLGAWLDGFETRAVGWPGSRASDDPVYMGTVVSARPYLQQMLGWPQRPNEVILAWGTNDVFVHTPAEIADAIDRLVQWMRSAGVVPLVASVPWLSKGNLAGRIAKLNGLLAARYGPCLIDFTTITPPTASWYVDRRHLNPAGQERRAIAATYALETLPRSCAAGVASGRP